MLTDGTNYLLTFVYFAASVTWVIRAENGPSDVSEPASLPGPGEGWQCQRPGRFSNPEDPSCRTYLTCIPEGDGFTLRQDECGPNALFSGRFQRCISGSDCATLDDFYAIEFECSECGKFVLPSSTDCRQFVNCLKTRDPGVFVPIRQSCPAGKLFSASAHACVPEEEFQCGSQTPAITTTLEPVVPSRDPQVDQTLSGGHLSDFVCLGPGRFPDESVPHCRGYRWCTAAEPEAGGDRGRLVSRNFLCEPGQVFSEVEKRCVPTDSYQCPDDDVSVERFRCEAVGRFPDRSAVGCETYFHCQPTATGTLRATLAQCPAGTVFSWLTTRCVPSAEYVCPVAAIAAELSPAEVVETVAVVVPPPEQEESKDVELTGGRGRTHRSRCSRSGRFANDADALCRTYFICTRDLRGAWVKVLVRCPAGTVFSRTLAHCVGSETDASCRPRRPSTVPPVEEPEPDGDDDDFDDSGEEMECSEPDRLLPNPTDRTCQTYFGCRWDEEPVARGRRLRLHLLHCPPGQLFSTGAARCVDVGTRVTAGAPLSDDLLDDGSAGVYSGFCMEPDAGSGEPIELPDAWSSTSTVTSAAPASTEQSTSTSTARPTHVPAVPAPTASPDDADGGRGGGGFSYSGPVPEYPCTATGRFADINSVDCRSYFLCKQQQPSGSLISVHLTCPDGMVFSRNVNKCIISNRHVC